MSVYPAGKPVQRETLVALLRAALDLGENRFARQAALAWLAAFPGDIEVALMQAQALLSEGRDEQAVTAVEMVCRKDPLSVDAYRMLAKSAAILNPERSAFAVTALYALGYPVQGGGPVEHWGEPLHAAIQAYRIGLLGEAEAHIQEVLREQSDNLLASFMHLLIHRAGQEALAVNRLAQIYANRWPDCVPVRLVLAETHMELGNEPEAVYLLHVCAADDATGQTARRLWGEQHSYSSLWTDDMVILFDHPVPAGVAGRLGWNQLVSGPYLAREDPFPLRKEAKAHTPVNPEPKGSEAAATPESAVPVEAAPPEPPAPETVIEVADAAGPEHVLEEIENLVDAAASTVELEQSMAHIEEALSGADVLSAAQSRQAGRRSPKSDFESTAQSVGSELGKLAKKLKQPGLDRMDGRHPVYVILSSCEGLEDQYGPQTASVLKNEMRKLSAVVQQRPGWGAAVYFPDDAVSTGLYGLTPVNPRDPWKVKNALCDLDVALRQRGEMIGALLIVGSDTVVPFHRLPNPTDDADGEVLSDSPYASLDANYFVPEWPVGRLPGEAGPDAALLLEQLRSMQRYHTRKRKTQSSLGNSWLGWIGSLFAYLLPVRSAPSFGYTAAVWRRSSLAVFRPVGAPHTVAASPPEHSGSVDRARITSSSLGYYNLHGLSDSPAWYGQRDPLDSSNCPDYPIALTPADLRRNGHSPKIVFSEACFGAHVSGKKEQDSLALKFLGMGTLVVIGSTCTAYGSMNTPLIAADLLGNVFWQHLKAGYTAGEALMQAKIDLVREMTKRQGFLDGEDQKTLISFVLYGDPLAGYDGFRVQSKAHRMMTHPMVKTVSDQPEDVIPPSQVSVETLKQVKSLVSEYLPGAELSEMHFTRQVIPSMLKGKPGAKVKVSEGGAGQRMVVTISKSVKEADRVHHHIMRVTLDEGGDAVKLSLSR